MRVHVTSGSLTMLAAALAHDLPLKYVTFGPGVTVAELRAVLEPCGLVLRERIKGNDETYEISERATA